MRTVRFMRTWLLTVGGIFLVLDLASVGLLLSPLGRSRDAKQDEFTALRVEEMNKRKENLPARDMDAKLKSARLQLDDFYRDRLPHLDSQLSEELNRIAAANHVQLMAARYERNRTEVVGVMRVEINMDVDGSYANQMRFLNALERSQLFLIPAQITFGGMQQSGLRVTLKLYTFLRANES